MEYTNPYHVLTITPSYRFSFGQSKEWGLKVGLGVGMSLADVTWGTAKTAKGASGKVAGGAIYRVIATCLSIQSASGSYSDSKGGAINGVTFLANECKTQAAAPGAGVSDKVLVDILNLKSSYFTYTSGTISYGIWRRLGADENAATTKLEGAKSPVETAGSYTGNFESRDAYIARCTTTACEGQAASATGAAAAAGIVETYVAPAISSSGGSGGSAKDDAGFVLAPEIALEYDNGLLHADINARYIHGLANVKYDGQNGTSNQLQRSGPLAIFIGAGFGVNF